MRFISFLNESFTKKITQDQCKKLLHTYCPKNLELTKKGKILYRGDEKTNENFILLDKSKRKPRKSAHTSNHYTILTSELLPQWKEFPRRDMGIICTTYLWNASNYGKVYKIIPFDDAKLAICPDDDFWHSFNRLFKIDGPRELNNIMNNLGVKDTKSSISNFMKQKIVDFKGDEYYLNIFKLNLLSFFTGASLEEIHKGDIIDLLKEWDSKIKDVTFGDLLEKMYDPTSNGFKLISSLQNIKYDREVWFDGSAIMINNEIELDEF